MEAVYDEIGHSYVVTRQPDTRLAQAIRAALGEVCTAHHTALHVASSHCRPRSPGLSRERAEPPISRPAGSLRLAVS